MGELDELPQRELDRWVRYWHAEPWGSHRDNLHAALIVTELLKPHLPEGTTMKLEQFMLQPKEDLDEAARARVLASLSAMAAAGERKQQRRGSVRGRK